MGTIIVLAALIVTFSFVPFITGTYGEVGSWCWIFSIDKNCEVHVIGLVEQIFFWIFYHSLISLICILMITAAVVLLLRACLYKIKQFKEVKDSHHNYKHISIKYIFQLFILVPVFFDFGDFLLVAHIHHYSFSKWVILAIAAPISGLAIPLSFLLYMKFGNAGSENNQAHAQANPPADALHPRADINQQYEEQVTSAVSEQNAYSAANLRVGIQGEPSSFAFITSRYTTPSSGYVTADSNATWAKGHDIEKQTLLGDRRRSICLIQ